MTVTDGDKIVIVEWTPTWAHIFARHAHAIRHAMNDLAVRVDHIGSTAIQGMAAKPIIDIQVSVKDLQAQETQLVDCMKRAGFVWHSENPDLTKRYFRERPGEDRLHIHMRQHGSWNEQWALLFRDYMRTQDDEHAAYIALKRQLAAKYADDRASYVAGKSDHLWQIMKRADAWASQIGWQPAESDG